MKNSVLKLIVISLLVVNVVQAKRAKKSRYNCEKKTNHAIERFKKGRFTDAKIILDEVKINCNGSAILDTAIYYLAKANLGSKSPQAALLELQAHIQDFPNSHFSEEIQFLIGVAYYDQTPTFERDQTKTTDAIREFKTFISLFPNSAYIDSSKSYIDKCKTKLARKEFETAQLYYNLKKYTSAIIYYQSIIDNFNDSKFLEPAALALAKSLTRVSRTDEAKQILSGIIESDYSTETKKSAANALERIKKYGDNAELSNRERKKALKKEAKESAKSEIEKSSSEKTVPVDEDKK
jgi:outer membrane protein assembly factor BamD